MLAQDKAFRPDPRAEYIARYCPLYDVAGRCCAVYPVRPLVCRLLGYVEWMPCPVGRALPPLADRVALMCDYYAMAVRPVGQWLTDAPLVRTVAAPSEEGVT